MGIKILLSDLLSRMSMASRAGIRFDGNRDYYAVFGYKRTLVFRDYLEKYARQDIAGRIIDAPAQATWRSPPKLTSESAPNFQESWESIVKDDKIWSKLERIDKLAGLGKVSGGILGFNNTGSFATPVNVSTSADPRRLLYIQPVAEPSIKIIEYETSSGSERFGKPTLYEINLADPNQEIDALPQSTRSRPLKVHWTRFLHVVEHPLQGDIVGMPRLARVFNLLDDLLKVTGGSAEAFWLMANRGLQADVDKEMELDTDDASDLADMLDEYQHQLRRVLRTRGVTINSLGSDTADPTGVFKTIMALISGATGIPQRILLGAEAGQLASEQDRANWAERVRERRTSFAQPIVLTPLIELLQQAGVLPEANDYEVEWPEAFHLSPLEKAETMAKRARATQNLSGRHKNGHPLISDDEAREIIGFEATNKPEMEEFLPEAGNTNEGGTGSTEQSSAAPGSQNEPDELDLNPSSGSPAEGQ